MLVKGQKAPAFSVENEAGKTISLDDYQGKRNFYPKDDTPGCTIEANDFTRLANEFSGFDTVVLGAVKTAVKAIRILLKSLS